MGLVNAKCLNCGANLKVDNKQKNGICENCGAKLETGNSAAKFDAVKEKIERLMKGEEIDMAARIAAVADVFDAICSKRSYNPR